MIYTSYFDMLYKLPQDIVPISICGQAPEWYSGRQYKKLAPKYAFFVEWQNSRDDALYTKCFKEQVLDKLDPAEVVKRLYELSSGRELALICYEKPGEFCHRHLVADWLTTAGYEAEEWQ